MTWREIEGLARSIFWPKLLHGTVLERFCTEYLPKTFADLKIPFVAIATELPGKSAVAILEGDLASAISASCALRGIRRPVNRAGKRLEDGGSRAFCHLRRAGPWGRNSLLVLMSGSSATCFVGLE